MKLGNFFTGNVFTISQSPHGSTQNGKAIDAVPTSGNRLIAPCDMTIYYRANNLGHQSYSYARGDGFTRLVLVHCIVEKSGFVKRGTDIGYLASGGPVHLHTAIEVNGAWDVVLNYMDRTVQLVLTTGFSSQHWKSWSTWKDLTLGSNNMADFIIPSHDYEYAKQYIPAFVQKYGGDLKGMNQYIWFFKHGAVRMNELLADKDAEIKALKAQIKKLEASIGGLTTDRNKYKEEVEMYKKEITRMQAETAIMSKKLEELEEQTKFLQQDNNILTQRNSDLVLENGELEAKVKTQAKHITELQDALARCKENNGQSTGFIKSILSALANFVRSIFEKLKNQKNN